MKSALERARARDFKVVRHARVPLVKCVYNPNEGVLRGCPNIVPGNAVPANSRLLKAYGDKAPAFRLWVVLKSSPGRVEGLNDASEGLSSYAHALTCLHFCLVRGVAADFHDAPFGVVEDIDGAWQEVL